MNSPQPEIEIRQLRYFVALAEALHFGLAAEQLKIAQPSLTRQIQLLEQQVGSPLFERTQRQVRLTNVGQIFLEQARLTLDQHQRAVESARNAASKQQDVLTVGFEPCATYHGLAQVVQAFSEQHPEIKLISYQLTSPDLEEAVLRGRIDAGFLHPPINHSQLVFEKVSDEGVLAVLNTAHPLARRRRIALADLALEPFILFPRQIAPACYDGIQALCQQEGFTPNVRHETNDFSFCLRLIGTGMGVTIAPSGIRERKERSVAYRSLSNKSPHIETGFVRRAGEMSPQLANLLTLWRTYAA
ncbi:MAG: LysR family transcriptional regulator [Anaerolineae bacterium]|nr:LysR family transcriptional regulator [Gloeobacterales cyanobacterium ES-bin-313]